MSFLSASSSQNVVLSQGASPQADQTAAVKDLENTIARFQAILTDDDRKNLQQLKTEPHDAQSIIIFTASLDRFDPKRRGKSVASRLASFLQTIEQFTPIVDTYIQSNPEIAALVWGSVRLTFQLLANFTSYFQSFVELLSGFGSLCSRFAEYQVIFKDSPRLKTSICAFHCSVVNCCEKIVLVTRRPMKSQAWMAITQSFQGEIRGYVDEIKSKAEIVRDDIQLAKAQCDSDEHQLQAKARQKAEESHGRISSLLAKARSEMRLIGDQGIRGTAVLHVTGKIGSGKTILAFDDPITLTSDTIIRSLVQQLLSMAPMETMDPALASEIADFLQKAQSNFFSLEALGKLYHAASKFTQDWFILIDGVDECESEQRRLLYDFFSGFLNTCSGPQRVKILFSSRETTKQEIDGSFGAVERLITGTSNTSADIVAFAEDVIATKLARGELVVGDPEIIGDILQAIASKEEGMFLWAFLAIEDICSGTNDKEIKEALQEIPTDLPTTFDRALSRIAKRRNQKIASEIFGWTTAARQPLTLTQLQEALSVKVGQRNLHPDDLASGIDRITVWCENMVCVEETDNTVHFSHHSIREYLLQPGSGDLEFFHVDLQEFDHHVGEVCITYLHLGNLKTALIESEKAEPPIPLTVPMQGLSEQTVRTVVGGSMGARVGRWTSHFIKSSARSAQPSAGDVAIHSTLKNLRHTPSAPRVIQYAFLEYAEGHWFQHKTRLVHSVPSAFSVLSGYFFMPPTGEAHLQAQQATDPICDLSPTGSLPFLAIYAVKNNNETLVCSQASMRIQDLAFAQVAVCDITKAKSPNFPSLWESNIFLTARTSSNMSIVDIAAEQNCDSLNFLEPLFQHGFVVQSADTSVEHQGEMKKLAFRGLRTAWRNGSSTIAEFLLEEYISLSSSGEASQFDQLDVINFRQALSQAAIFEWPLDTTKLILSWFFKTRIVQWYTEAIMDQLIEESVKAGNWNFAAAVVDAVPGPRFGRTESGDPFFKMALAALSCQGCRERQFWPEHSDTQLLSTAWCYKLCSEHERQARATLDPILYLTPDKGSLQLRPSESEEGKLPSDTDIEEDSILYEPGEG
ncbi:hypothetical protein CDV31_011425 [Fusarium ambrosium]|uniref:NACHT domain-containing protein n=1 Tax=Fusarium ambrosium TaxID=131363 RepID=A0A428TH48_9HYPO|nr:hypothetical protein CDV31_011425 [Fusarium ambrosium]